MNKLFTRTSSMFWRGIKTGDAIPKHLQEDEKKSFLQVASHSFSFYIKIFLLGIFLSSTFSVLAQQPSQRFVVKGKVLDDEDGQPLVGTTISDGAKKVLGVTNDNGDFSVTLQGAGSISFNMVGYTVVTRSISSNQNGLTIRLKSSNSQLNEVVVTALGIKRDEKALGYATTTVDSTQLTEAVATNWTDALSGKVAGLNLVRSNSGPGGSNKIILRGENNLTGDNEALVVVDGVVVSSSGGRRTAATSGGVYGTGSDNMPADYGSTINDINPEDIESVTVLKGPGASALYGQRGANGAIIITTKSGNSKRKSLGIKFTSNGSFEEVNRWPDLQYEYGQGLDGASYYSYGASADGASTSGTSSAYGPRFDPSLSFFQYDGTRQNVGLTRTPWVPYTNQIREFFSKGENLTNTLSVDGKLGKTTNFRTSISNQSNTWIIPLSGVERTNASLSINSDITKKLKLMAKVNYGNRYSDNLPGNGYGNQSIMYWFIFWQPNADLESIRNYWVNGQENRLIKYPYSSFPENPYAVVNEFKNKQRRNNVTGSIQLSYQFTKELSLLVRTSVDYAKQRQMQERPYDAGSKLIFGSYREQNSHSSETNSDFLIRYDKKVSNDFSFNLSAGGSQLKNRYDRSDIRADGLRVPNIYELSNNLYPLLSIPDTSRLNINSFYGILSNSYKNFLYLDITARKDWNSALASSTRTDNVGFFYPSASASFVMSEVVKMPKFVNMAKFRFSASQVGSGSLIPYRTAYTYGLAFSGSYPDSALVNPGLLANSNLKPLRTTTYELGADIRLFKNRLNFDIAVYAGKTNDQHLTRIVDRATGYNQMLINAGQVNNKGLEISVNGSQIKSKNGFNWSTYMTFSTNQNKIIDMNGDSSVVLRTGPVAGGQIVAKVGGSMGDLYGRGYVRDPEGNVVFDATTGLAKITNDVVYLGNTIPRFKGSIGNNFSYRQFSLNLLFDAQIGAVAHSLLNYKLVEQGKTTSTLPGRYSGIIGNGVVQNPDGTYRKNDVIATDIDEYYRSNMGADNAEGSTFSTDFIKFREAALTYKFKPSFLKKIGLNSASFGVYGRNLFIWSPWPMFDPEFGTISGSDIVQGFEIGQFPSTRTYGFNLSIGI